MSFRVQEGDNDPTALVRSQMKVTRAIADAAISIAGAASGVSLVPVAGSEPKLDTSGVAESESLARQGAFLEARADQRKRTAGMFAASLRNLRSRLAETDDPEKIVKTQRELESMLTA